MRRYIFLTNEGSTYQPNSNSVAPDCENTQVIGFAEGNTKMDAFNNLLNENRKIKETAFNEVYCYQIEDDKPKYFYIK